jgi:hypothetical protein
VEEYLTIAQTATRLNLKPKTLKNKMAAGIFRKGVHYFSPRGIGPRFKWSAVEAWLAASDKEKQGGILMRRGYVLTTPTTGVSNDYSRTGT